MIRHQYHTILAALSMGVIQKLYDFVNPEFFILAAKAREIFTPARMMTLSYNLCMIITALLNARLLLHLERHNPPCALSLPHKLPPLADREQPWRPLAAQTPSFERPITA